MGKQPPNLKLVSSGSAGQAGIGSALQSSSGFDFITLNELSSSEQGFIKRLLAEICPGAGIIAVARSPRTWDLRPVVALSGEEGPSIIRLSGPQVSFSKPLHRRVRESLERLNRFTTLRTELRDWGEYEDQIWFRRTLVSSTLAHDISGGFRWSPEDVYRLIHALFEVVASFHSHGLIHGHIATTNIVFTETGGLALLDPAIGAALVQSEPDLDSAQAHSVAPEMLGRVQLQASADCFGLGQVSKRLLLKLRRKSQFLPEYEEVDKMVEQLLKIVAPMVNTDPGARPALPELLVAVEDAISGAAPSIDTAVVEQPDSVSSGRIVRSGLPAEEQIVQEEEEEDELLPEENQGEPEQPAAEEQPLEPKNSNWWLYLIGLLSIAFCVWTVYQQRQERSVVQYSAEELRLAWESSIPSRMAPVAELALQEDGQTAEDLIIRSIYNGARLPQGVNTALVKAAFDARWERKLNDTDRRMALALGVAALLGSNYPKDLGPLEERHPGLIFAVVATAGKNANPFLERIPALVLEKLPGTLGSAFAVLAANDKNYTCASEPVRMLAQFSTRGVGRTTELADFLSKDTGLRLQALAKLYDRDNPGARVVLEATISHPNMIIEHPLISWGREWELNNWAELESTDKLAVLAGYPPRGRVLVENVGKMFSHPSAPVRGYAIERAIDRIRFAHPGSFTVLRQLVQKPELLDGMQLFQLAKLLENPAGANGKQIKEWLAKKPPVQLVSQLLIAGHDQKAATKLDTFAAMYLKSEKWEPSMAQLRLLILHPDDYTRLYAYQQVFMREGPEVPAILREARKAESSGRFKVQLDQMIGQLSE